MKQRTATVLGVFGYLALSLEWLWAGILLFPSILASKNVKDMLLLPPQHTVPMHAVPIVVSPVILAVSIVISVGIVALGIRAALTTPKRFVRATSKTTHAVAGKLAKEVTHHHTVTQRHLFTLTERYVRIVKLFMIIIPFVSILLSAQYLSIDLSPSLIVFVGGYLALWPLIWFSLQVMVQHSDSKTSAL